MEIPNGLIHLMRGDLAAGFERLIVIGWGGLCGQYVSRQLTYST